MKQKKYIFASTDDKINDLEWKLPFIIELKESSNEVEVWLFFYSKLDKETFNIFLLKQNGIKICYREDFESFIYHFLKTKRSKTFYNFLFKISQSSHNMWSRLMPFLWVRLLSYRSNINKRINGVDAFFLCYRHESDPHILSTWIYNSVREKSKKLVGLPLAGFNHWYFSSLYPFDEIWVSTESERTGAEKITDIPVKTVGARQFNKKWIERFSESYKKFDLNLPYLDPASKSALILLTSKVHPFWDLRDYFSTTVQLLKIASAENDILVLKPHPRDSRSELNMIIKEAGIRNYVIVDGYIGYWASQAKSLYSLISMGTLFSLSFNVVPYVYWPMNKEYCEQLDLKGRSATIDSYFYRDENKNYVLQYDQYVYHIRHETGDTPVLTKSEELQKISSFKKDFIQDIPISLFFDEV